MQQWAARATHDSTRQRRQVRRGDGAMRCPPSYLAAHQVVSLRCSSSNYDGAITTEHQEAAEGRSMRGA